MEVAVILRSSLYARGVGITGVYVRRTGKVGGHGDFRTIKIAPYGSELLGKVLPGDHR